MPEKLTVSPPPRVEMSPHGGRFLIDLESFVDERLEAGSEDLLDEVQLFAERYLIARVLVLTRGNQSKTARILGITRGTLRHKIQLQHITIERVVRPESQAETSHLTVVNDPEGDFND